MLTLADYKIQEQLHHGRRSVVYRAFGEREGRSVVLKTLADPYPLPADVAALEHEFEIGRRLDVEGVLAHHALVQAGKSWVLVLEDFGGRAVGDLLAQGGPLDVATFLEIAQPVARALAEIHARNIIHKDLNPGSILYNARTHEVRIADFGMASLLLREKQEFRSSTLIEGTLEYMAPEQTGRMNRAIDYRTDFYSLGATFFHLLAGVQPFLAKEPLELVHCHVAKTPVPPPVRREAVPEALWAIVRKLMAKNAEDRYQSALGLEHDLAECARQLREKGAITPFPLGEEDRSQGFRISEKLYGREAPVATLMEAFDRVASTGRCELVTVGGYSGVGKSVLVREVHKPIAARRGYFVGGKCDYLNQDTPLAPLIQAFAELVRHLLTEPEERLARWRERLLEALGGNGQLVTDLISELRHVIGEQPPVMVLPPVEAKERFAKIFQQFVLVFAREEHPLVVFIDDLQWVDAASLRLLMQLATNPAAKHLLLIGAYRDNEVSPAHALMLGLRDLEERAVPVTRLQLNPLGLEELTSLLSDTLRCDRESVATLAAPLFDKTGGNPFFVTQFLHTLHDEGILRFDTKAKRWIWDVVRIHAFGASDNVVDLMVSKIKKYPEATQHLLMLASSMGNTFDLNTVSIISARLPREAAIGLWEAVKDGLILPLDNNYHYYQWAKHEEGAPLAEEVRYRFAHDRVQEAAYSQIPAEQRAGVSLRIGRLLLERTPSDHRMERIFELVGHLNLGAALMTERAEKDQVAELNLLAGQKAKASTAYQAAVRYLVRGIELLPSTAWDTNYELMFLLQRELIECEFLCGNLSKAEQLFAVVSKQTRGRKHLGDIYQLMIRICHTAGKITEGLRIGQESLRLFDVELPTDPERVKVVQAEETAKIQRLMGGRDILSLVDLPLMKDRDIAIAMGLLHETWTCGVMCSDFNTLILTALKMVRLSLEHGHCEFAACGYVAHALILSVSGDTPNAYAFGTLAMRLNQKFANPFVIPKVNNTFANFVNHYSNHIADNVPIYQESYQSCLRSGDRWWGAWAAGWIRSAQFIKGDPLDKVLETCDLFHQYIQDSGYHPLYQMLLLDRHLALALQGKTLNKLSLSAGPFSEEGLVKSLTEMGFEFGLYWYWLMKALLNYLHERHAQALACVREASKRKDFIAFLMTYPDFFLYESLILAANHDRVEPAEQERFRETISANIDRMRGWAVHCKGNFEHRHLLMSAELARLQGEHARAEDLYEQAIDAAHDSRYVHHEALANELAAKHGLLRRRPKAAKGYLIEARYLYSRWGAFAKVTQLAATYPQLFAVQSTPGTISATEWTDRERNPGSTKVENQTLELATVMKAAQALSQEIVLGKLLERMMRIGMENAGAQRGVLLVERDGNLLVEASAAVDGHITVQQSIPVDQAQDLPLSIIKYVQRTGETLTLDDAASDPRFQADPYLARNQIKSVLCLPSMRQAGRLGIFYLENNLVKGAFPPERTRVLQVLSTQAAISLENAVLYATMEQRVQERTAQLARSNEEVSQTLQRLKDTQKQLVLQEKLASLGTLTAGIAHEIKNPLNFVNNFAELSVGLSDELRKELEDHRDKLGADTVEYLDELLSDLRQNVEKINEHGKRADRIVRGMLDHARLNAGDKRPVNVNALLTEYVNLAYQGLRSQNQSINVAIETSYDDSLRPVELAPQEFGRVVLNLVNNACHAVLARKGGAGGSFSPTIRVSTREQGGVAEIRIRDNGTGIPPSVREKIFTPFFTTKPPGEGTGLGLSISHQIIEGLGGTLRFESEEGKFTEFIITLPEQKQESRAG